jgi:hypothetical protein
VPEPFVTGMTVDLAPVREPVQHVAVDVEEIGEGVQIVQSRRVPPHADDPGRRDQPLPDDRATYRDPPGGRQSRQLGEKAGHLPRPVGRRLAVGAQDRGHHRFHPAEPPAEDRGGRVEQRIGVPRRGEEGVGERGGDLRRGLAPGRVPG